MNQQSQAQSQAQTQAQIAALREQNAILNQQLNSQAHSFHQPPQPVQAPSIPPTVTIVRTSGTRNTNTGDIAATQSGPTPSFNFG